MNEQIDVYKLVECLLDMNQRTMRILFFTGGMVIAFFFAIVDSESDPQSSGGFWLHLFGAIVGVQLLGLLAWKSFKNKKLDPFRSSILNKVQNQPLQPTPLDAGDDTNAQDGAAEI